MIDIKFKAWDKETKKWLHDEFEELGMQYNLMSMDMDGFAVTDSGDLILMDDCGSYVYLDRNRFDICVLIEDKKSMKIKNF